MARAHLIIGKTDAEVSLNEKEFKTGSRGYHGQTKLESDGKRYQVSILAVEIGSKNSAE